MTMTSGTRGETRNEPGREPGAENSSQKKSLVWSRIFSRAYPGTSRRGFTLVELLVVISIIGILAALLLVNLSNIRERSRDTRRKSDLGQIKTALRLYYNDFQTYPAAGSGGVIAGCDDGTANCAWGGDFSANGAKYMTLPTDPLTAGTYLYAQTNGGDGFQLVATMENLSDPSIQESQERCGVPVGDIQADQYMICAE